MSVKPTLLVCAISLLAVSSGSSAPPPSSPASLPGSDVCNAPATTIEITDCHARELDAAEGRLKAALKKLMDGFDESDKNSKVVRDKVLKAQQLWRSFVQADCDAHEAVYEGGSIVNSVGMVCGRDHIDQRIKELDPANWQ